jgi:DNA-binding winged helix-turn-helix (wHTH) protein
MLLERKGKIVTREEMKSRLWANDMVVDFDQSINATIKARRRGLVDSADNPRYIETLGRRGYRLMPIIDIWSQRQGRTRRVRGLASHRAAEIEYCMTTAPKNIAATLKCSKQSISLLEVRVPRAINQEKWGRRPRMFRDTFAVELFANRGIAGRGFAPAG